MGQELGDDLAGADDRESQSASPIASRTTPSSGAVSWIIAARALERSDSSSTRPAATIDPAPTKTSVAPIAVDLAQPDWVPIAAVFGGTGHRAESASALAEAVTTAGDAGDLHVIHLPQSAFTK